MTTSIHATEDPGDVERAMDVLRAWALDEALKHRVMSDPELAALAARVARRYTAGDSIEQAVTAARAATARGHLVSIEYAGESVRDPEVARAEAAVFLELVRAIGDAGLPSTVSLDLSHVGAVIDKGLALELSRPLAEGVARLGTALMISAEGSRRTDLVLGLYDELAEDHPHVGITLQARLRRTPEDLERVLLHPGQIRLVKGAFAESPTVAHRRGSDDLQSTYLALVRRLVASGHAFTIATHDERLIQLVIEEHGAALKRPGVEFEMLRGLAPAQLDSLRARGYLTREYVVFGGEWWLYVLNRIAEQPERVFTAIADLRTPDVPPDDRVAS